MFCVNRPVLATRFTTMSAALATLIPLEDPLHIFRRLLWRLVLKSQVCGPFRHLATCEPLQEFVPGVAKFAGNQKCQSSERITLQSFPASSSAPSPMPLISWILS